MRKRNIRSQVWLNQDEATTLQTNSKKAGLSQESYLRTLINSYVPKELPSPDYTNVKGTGIDIIFTREDNRSSRSATQCLNGYIYNRKN